MSRRIAWLVAATTSAVVVAFIAPLCFLVANIAQDRAVARVQSQAQGVATLYATSTKREDLDPMMTSLSAEGPSVFVVTPEQVVLGGAAPMSPSSATAVRRARRELVAFTVAAGDGVQAYVPVVTSAGTAVVVSSAPQSQVTAGVGRAWAIIIALGSFLIVFSVLLARDLGRRIATPVTDVASVAQRLRAGDRSARAKPSGPPEAIELGTALNALADRIDGLVAAEREHVADLGHRLRTPITALRIDTELIADSEVADRLREHVDHLQRSVDAVVREARRPVRESLPTVVDLAHVVRERVAFWTPLAEDQNRSLSFDADGQPLRVAISASDLIDLVDILLDNVFAHTPEGAAFEVRVGVASAEAAEVEISDAGPGLRTGYRGRGASGSGSTGLGLDIARRIATDAGGTVLLESGVLGGLTVRVRLPLV